MSEHDASTWIDAYCAAAERVMIGGERRYVRLHEEPMRARDVLPWLEKQGLVKRVPTDDPDSNGYRLLGWGDPYCSVPFDRTVRRVSSDYYVNDATTWKGRWRQTLRADNKVVYHRQVCGRWVRVPWLAWAMFS